MNWLLLAADHLNEAAVGGGIVTAVTVTGLLLLRRKKTEVNAWPLVIKQAIDEHREFARTHPAPFDTELAYQNVLFRARALGAQMKMREPKDLPARAREALASR